MTRRNGPCPCGSGQKFKRCCLHAPRLPPGLQAVLRRPPPPGLDAVTTEAYLRSQELLGTPDVLERMSVSMGVLRGMFREGGPLAGMRWPWEELVPVVERHIFRVMEETDEPDERHERMFERCAPELLGPGQRARMDAVLRRALMAPERTAQERCALGLAVMEQVGASRGPPDARAGLGIAAWLLMGQVDEWMARRQHVQEVVDRVLGEEPGGPRGPFMSARVMRRVAEQPELMEQAMREAAAADPELMELLGQYEVALLHGILEGRTPEVLQGEEWLWVTVVLREPLRAAAERALGQQEAVALLARLDAEVRQAVLQRVEAASRDRSATPEAEQWFTWAYKVLVVRPLGFFGAFAQTRDVPLRERFAGEAQWVRALRGRERWRAEDLEPYRLRLEALGARGAEQRVRRLQAHLRGEAPTGAGAFEV